MNKSPDPVLQDYLLASVIVVIKEVKMNSGLMFETIFLIFLFGNIVLSFFLYLRQVRFINVQRGQVPHVFAGQVSIETHQSAADKCLRIDQLYEIRHIVFLLLIFFLSFFSFLPRMASVTEEFFGDGVFAQTIVALEAAALFLIADALFAFFSQSGKGALYFSSLSNRPLALLIGFMSGVILLTVTFALWGSEMTGWWLWSWLTSVLIVPASVWLYEALAFRGRPMPESPLRDRLNEFLSKAGFVSSGIFLSDRSAAARPARIVGFGSARKLILEARLLDQLTPLETEALIAIEIGRTKYCSAVKVSVIFMFLSFFFFLFLELAVKQPWFFQGLGVNSSEVIGHGEAFVLFSMAVFVFMFPLIPIKNLFMRSVEENAERFSVKLLDWNSMISAIVKAFADRAGSIAADPLYRIFYISHPDELCRIKAIQRMAPRHTRQRDSWLPNA